MSNLSDLLPAGAGGKQVDFVASGALANGQTVALKTNGTVEVVSGQNESYGTAVSSGSDNSVYFSGCYNATTSRIIIIGRGPSSDVIYMIGTVSGNAITFLNGSNGTAIPPYSGVTTNFMGIASESNSAYVMFVTQEAENNNYGAAIAGLISGSSISWGSRYQFASVNVTQPIGISYDPDANRFLTLYQQTNQNGYAIVLQRTSGTNITSGNRVLFGSSEAPKYFGLSYDTAADKTLITWAKLTGSSGGARAAVASISGTTVTIGTVLNIPNSPGAAEMYTAQSALSYDPVLNKHLLLTQAYFSAGGNFNCGAVILSVSGAAVTGSGAPTAIVAAGGAKFLGAACVYHPASGLFAVGIINGSTGYLTAGTCNISTGTPVLSSLTTTSTVPVSNYALSSFLNTDIGNVAFVVKGTNNDAHTQMYAPASSNSSSFIGITDAAIANGASGSVTIKGGISSNVTSLTPNTTYYVQTNGTLSTGPTTVLAGKALSSTSINLDYTT